MECFALEDRVQVHRSVADPAEAIARLGGLCQFVVLKGLLVLEGENDFLDGFLNDTVCEAPEDGGKEGEIAKETDLLVGGHGERGQDLGEFGVE